jgi:hypothetical protein
MAFVRNVDKGFFPLDEELELLPGSLTPHGHEMLVRLAGWMPFEKASQLFEDFMGIQVSKSVSQRYTEAAGAAYEALQTEEVERLEREAPLAPAGADKMQMSTDGAMVPLRHGQWAEVKTLVVGEVQEPVQEGGERVVHTRNLSYFSRKVTSEVFERLALVEIQRRGVENARQVASVNDGADWEQSFTDYHRPDAVRILDFPHAGDHISEIGEFLYGEGTPETKQWLEERLHQLKHSGPAELLAEFRTLQNQHPEEKAVSGNLAYLEKRISQIQYPQFQAEGWPIGSEIVESGNKLVVEARLKGSGMHWADGSVNPMLAIRNILCSDRWKKDWPKVAVQLRHQASQQRHELHATRRSQATLRMQETSIQSLPVVTEIFQEAFSESETPVIPKKPKENPWRRFKFGRALYQRQDPPK